MGLLSKIRARMKEKLRETKRRQEEWKKLYTASSNEIKNEAKKQSIELLVDGSWGCSVIAELTRINQRGASYSLEFFVHKGDTKSTPQLGDKLDQNRRVYVPSNYRFIGQTPNPAAEKEYYEKKARIRDIDRKIGAMVRGCGKQRAQEEYSKKLKKWQSIPLSEWEKRNAQNGEACKACYFGKGFTWKYVLTSGWVRGGETPQIQEKRTCTVCKGTGKIDASTLRLLSEPKLSGYEREWDTDEMKKLRRERDRLLNKEIPKLKRTYSVYIKITEIIPPPIMAHRPNK